MLLSLLGRFDGSACVAPIAMNRPRENRSPAAASISFALRLVIPAPRTLAKPFREIRSTPPDFLPAFRRRLQSDIPEARSARLPFPTPDHRSSTPDPHSLTPDFPPMPLRHPKVATDVVCRALAINASGQTRYEHEAQRPPAKIRKVESPLALPSRHQIAT